MGTKRRVRIGFGAVVLACLLLLAGSFAAAVTTDTAADPETEETVSNASATASERNLTVYTEQGTSINGKDASLQARTANESLAYHQEQYSAYFDVDPVTEPQGFDRVPAGRYTVEFVAAELLHDRKCPRGIDRCTRNVVERVNLTTGNSTRVYARVTPGVDATRYHDADRINATHLAIADIFRDRLLVVNASSDEITWRWNASDDYDAGDAASPGSDWTHINDVEVLDDGTMMVSLRNLDQVAFVEPGAGLQENRTLGADEDHSVLYEQHNPDYLSDGPTVLIADSENNRIVEYRREGSEWDRTWIWRDAILQWPRDADRLPGGNTLVVDSHGGRVLEVGPNGNVRWSVEAIMPYDAERLGTGDESVNAPVTDRDAAGASDASTDDESARVGSVGPVGRVWIALKSVLPPILVNSALYVAPAWVGFSDLVFAVIAFVTAGCWGGLELRWSSYSVRDAGR
jgi:hypothetical protein